jgi:hypothetical protein
VNLKDSKPCLDLVLETLNNFKGVKKLKVLSTEEKKGILELEEEVETKIAYGMCKTINLGIRKAIKCDYTLALVIDTSIYEYPHHPSMVMVFDKDIVGEEIKDPKQIEELKKIRTNFFLWDNFVIYTRRLPKGKEARQRLRLIYNPRGISQFDIVECVKKGIFGTPSSEGDILVKNLLDYSSKDPLLGTCLIGFDVKKLH